ncbi:CocE/NonD family hydrolase [Nocardia sp. NBC_00881]|nr:CocE/NonD family hydrolase [Nocardia sp. NBC_00881]
MLDVTIEHDVSATMRDGVVLRADVYRPTTGGPWPVLLTRLPYGKNTPMFAAMLGSVGIARRGFLVVVQDTRGRFASDGEWEPWTFEMEDGYDTVRWAAALPGSNGSVGMFGGSYLGNTQWMAALAKPPELNAISPRITWSEPDDGLFARAIDTDLFLRADDRLAFDAPGAGERTGAFTYDPTDPVPTTGGALLMSNEFPPGPLDQARVEARPDVLVYTSDPLAKDLEITGRIQAYLTAATDDRLGCPPLRRRHRRPLTQHRRRHRARGGDAGRVHRTGHRPVVDQLRVPRRSPHPGARHIQQLPVLGPEPEHGRAHRARNALAPGPAGNRHDATKPSRIVLPVIPAPTKG